MLDLHAAVNSQCTFWACGTVKSAFAKCSAAKRPHATISTKPHQYSCHQLHRPRLSVFDAVSNAVNSPCFSQPLTKGRVILASLKRQFFSPIPVIRLKQELLVLIVITQLLGNLKTHTQGVGVLTEGWRCRRHTLDRMNIYRMQGNAKTDTPRHDLQHVGSC